MEAHIRTPLERQAALGRIAPIREEAQKHHSELLQIFEREMGYRSGDTADENPDDNGLKYFENIYWCAFLLFIIGDVNDVPLLWKAKNLNMDLAIGMEWEFLVGAGIDETVRFAMVNKMDDLAEYLQDYQIDPPSLVEWTGWRRQYFYDRPMSRD